MINLYRLIGKVFFILDRKFHAVRNQYIKSCFAECGTQVEVGHNIDCVPGHIHIGHHVYIGPNASFMASIAHIYIGNYVMFGPNCTIRGGDHRMDVIGKHIYEISESEKLPENDQDVIIEDGVWCGCNVG